MTADERTDVAALREALDAATPRPWEASEWQGGYEIVWTPTSGDFAGEPVQLAGDLDILNAALIVAAVNALPTLLDELEQLRDRVNRRNRHGKYDEERIKTLTAELDAARATIARVEALADDAHEVTVRNAQGYPVGTYQAVNASLLRAALAGDDL